MKVPNAELAVIDGRKLRNYLLSSSHPVGRYKARFFQGLGFNPEDEEHLATGLRAVLANDVSRTIAIEYGTKYVVPGQLEATSGARASIVTIWIILTGENVPRFVTAYPGRSHED